VTTQLRDQQRFLVVDVAFVAVFGIDLDRFALRLHLRQHLAQVILPVFRDVAGGQDAALVIHQDDRHGFVLLHHFEQEFRIVSGADLFLGLRP
jgi:hypothetical protein